MIVLDPGHAYALRHLSGGGFERLQFEKRTGDRYPGNIGPPRPGTTMQEVLRALHNRAQYVNRQFPCAETEAAISLLAAPILLFEIRAKRVKGKTLDVESMADVLAADTCPVCSHVFCLEHREERDRARTGEGG